MVELYIHDGKNEVDFREPHNSGTSVEAEKLAEIGVIYKFCETQSDVDAIAKERDYKNRDTVDICLETFNNDEKLFMDKLTMFYNEHLHEDEEIRYCIDGEGYFDVRGKSDKDWIRAKMTKGDLLVLPAGIYHRFTLTSTNHIKALRLFKDEPKWQAINRPDGDKTEVRKNYLAQI